MTDQNPRQATEGEPVSATAVLVTEAARIAGMLQEATANAADPGACLVAATNLMMLQERIDFARTGRMALDELRGEREAGEDPPADPATLPEAEKSPAAGGPESEAIS